MRVSFHQTKGPFELPTEPPEWAKTVSRWYQLDAYAYKLADLFYRSKPEFDYLILSSPGASNETDLEFVKTGTESAQRFVHTLPNIRAAMAMQSIEKVASFCCLQNGETTLLSGLEEFFNLSQEGHNGAWASVHILPNDDASQDWTCYGAILISKDEKGPWELSFDSKNTNEISDMDFMKSIEKNGADLKPKNIDSETVESQNKTRPIYKLGPFTLEKVR